MAFTTYRNLSLNSTVVTGVTSGSVARGFNILNPNPYPVYVKFWDVDSTGVTLGTTPTIETLVIPAGESTKPADVYEPWQDKQIVAYFKLQTGNHSYMTFAVTKFYPDSDTTAVATNVQVTFYYE